MFKNKRSIVRAIQALLVIGAVVAGCGKPASEAEPKGSSTATSELYRDAAGASPLHNAARQPGAERNVARRGTLDVEVSDLEAAEKKVSAFVTENKGYLAQVEGNGLAGEHATMHIVLRVPENSFETVMSLTESLGKRTSKSVYATDLTEPILDLEAQIQQAQAREKGDRNLDQSTRTSKYLQQQKDALLARATMSVIDLTLHQKPSADRDAAANSTWGTDTWNAAVSSAMGAFRGVGAILIWLVVYSPFWIPTGLVCWLLLRPRRQPTAPL